MILNLIFSICKHVGKKNYGLLFFSSMPPVSRNAKLSLEYKYLQILSIPGSNLCFHLFSLVSDLSPEAAAMLLAAVIGGYTLIGGLGATFYVSYFNTMLIFILILMLVIEVRYFGSYEFRGFSLLLLRHLAVLKYLFIHRKSLFRCQLMIQNWSHHFDAIRWEQVLRRCRLGQL